MTNPNTMSVRYFQKKGDKVKDKTKRSLTILVGALIAQFLTLGVNSWIIMAILGATTEFGFAFTDILLWAIALQAVTALVVNQVKITEARL